MYISEQQDADFLRTYESAAFIVDKVGFGNYKAFKVRGDSMDGGGILNTQNNAIVLARELQKHHSNGWV